MTPLLTRILACADPSQAEGLSRFFKTGQETGFPGLEECIGSEYHEVLLAAAEAGERDKAALEAFLLGADALEKFPETERQAYLRGEASTSSGDCGSYLPSLHSRITVPDSSALTVCH